MQVIVAERLLVPGRGLQGVGFDCSCCVVGCRQVGVIFQTAAANSTEIDAAIDTKQCHTHTHTSTAADTRRLALKLSLLLS